MLRVAAGLTPGHGWKNAASARTRGSHRRTSVLPLLWVQPASHRNPALGGPAQCLEPHGPTRPSRLFGQPQTLFATEPRNNQTRASDVTTARQNAPSHPRTGQAQSLSGWAGRNFRNPRAALAVPPLEGSLPANPTPGVSLVFQAFS